MPEYDGMNYRVIRIPEKPEWLCGSWYEIREVYYDSAGNPTGASKEAVTPYGETPEELREDILRILGALDKPILHPVDNRLVPYEPGKADAEA